MQKVAYALRALSAVAVLSVICIAACGLARITLAAGSDTGATIHLSDQHPDTGEGTHARSDEDSAGGAPVPYSDLTQGIIAAIGRNRTVWIDITRSERGVLLNLNGRKFCSGSPQIDLDQDGECDPCLDADLPVLSLNDPLDGVVFDVNFTLVAGEDLDDMPVGVVHADFARLRFEAGGEDWELSWGDFRVPGGRTLCPGCSPVLVERTSNDVWEIKSTGNHLAALFRRRTSMEGGGYEYFGQFALPFAGTAVANDPQDEPAGPVPPERQAGDPACVQSICGDSLCDGSEDSCSCAADCGAPLDQDGDGFDACSDCDDSDPFKSPLATEICDDGVDNDCDGEIDCDDGDCTTTPECPDCVTTHDKEKGPRCRDGVDNDCDGLIDSDDPDC